MSDLNRARPLSVRRSRPAVIFLAGLLCALLGLAAAVPAGAAEPLKIREIYPGSTAHGAGAEFVELQMTADNQGGVAGQQLLFFEADGDPIPGATVTLGSVSLVAASQRTLLLATSEAAVLGGGAAAPDVVLPSENRMDPAGGAVCFTGPAAGPPADCVTWGSFPPAPGPFEPQPIPDPQISNAVSGGGITDGNGLTRDISRGCPTYLDGPDDTGSSAADFALAAPSPRANASVPTETRCPPDTFITAFPQNPTNSSTASFSFAALPDEPELKFQCELDGNGSFSPGPQTTQCDSGSKVYESLADGQHTFRVRAVGEGGPDLTPASRTWTVDTVAPETTITSTPPSPNSGFSVTYTYSSSEPNSTFRCQMDDGAIQVCSSAGRTYFNLIDGAHTFRVWATDNAGNQDPTPATHSFSVITALADLTPPDTVILMAPPAVSPTDSAFFAYASTESPSTFQCSLNSAPFTPCPEVGISYGGLPNGPHLFAVRAIDGAGNVDSVPATHAWRVAAPLPRARISRAPAGRVALRPKLRPCNKLGAAKAKRRCVNKAVRRARVRVVFRFNSSKPNSTFRCRVGKRAFRSCRAPFRFNAPRGRHRFEVIAIDSLGNRQAAPTRRIFRVIPPRQGGLFG